MGSTVTTNFITEAIAGRRGADAVEKSAKAGNANATSQLLTWLGEIITRDGNIEKTFEAVKPYLVNVFGATQATTLEKELFTRYVEPLQTIGARSAQVFLGEAPALLECISNVATVSAITGKRVVPEGKEAEANGQMALNLATIYQNICKEFADTGMTFKHGDSGEVLAHNRDLAIKLGDKLQEKITANAASFSPGFLKSIAADLKVMSGEAMTIHVALLDNDARLMKYFSSDEDAKKALSSEPVADDVKKVLGLSGEGLKKLQDSVLGKLAQINEVLEGGEKATAHAILAGFSKEEKIYLNLKLQDAAIIRESDKSNTSISEFIAKLGIEKFLTSGLSTGLIGCVFGFLFGAPMFGAMAAIGLSFLSGLSDETAEPKRPAPARLVSPQRDPAISNEHAGKLTAVPA